MDTQYNAWFVIINNMKYEKCMEKFWSGKLRIELEYLVLMIRNENARTCKEQ